MIFIITILQMGKPMPAEGVGLPKVPELKAVVLRYQFQASSQFRLEVYTQDHR